MSIWSTLLRVLLCASLVINGSGYAVAAVQMQMHHADGLTAQPAATVTVAPEQPCHQGSAADVVTSIQGLAVEPIEILAGSDTSDAGCCDSGVCSCDCAHHGQATLSAYASVAALATHADAAGIPGAGHAAPALPHLIRPPIR